MLRVSPSGGNAEPLASLADGEVIQVWPQFLPGGKGVLYTGSGVPGAYNDANIMVQPLPGGTAKVVHRGGYHGRYLSSGHLVYIHDGTLFAAPFNLDRLEVTGEPVRAREAVTSNSVTGGAQFAVSASGTLVYRPGDAAGGRHPSPLDESGRENGAAGNRAGEVVQSRLLFRWPDRNGDPRGTTEYLGVRAGRETSSGA